MQQKAIKNFIWSTQLTFLTNSYLLLFMQATILAKFYEDWSKYGL